MSTPPLGSRFPSFARSIRLFLLTTGVTLSMAGLQKLGIFQVLEWATLDKAFRLRPVENQKPPIVLVTISETDLVQLNQFPISDQTLSIAIEAIKQENPVVIGLDLYRDLPVEPGHQQLLKTFTSTPNLIGIEKAVKDSSGGIVNPPPILRDRHQVAFNDLIIDEDGKIRRNLLSIRQNDKTQLALGTQLALTYLQKVGIQPQRQPSGAIQLGKVSYYPLLSNTGGYVRADTGGFQILSNYLRLPKGLDQISIQDVIAGRIPPDLMRDRIVLIGSTAESNRGDRFFVPYSTQSQETWFGVEVHANLVAQLISSAIEGRGTLSGLPEALEVTWILLWSSLGTSLGWLLRSRCEWGALPFSMIMLFLSAYGLFLMGWWTIVISPLIGFLSALFISRCYWFWSELKRINESLEGKVLERTQELFQQNIQLQQARLAADTANRSKSLFIANMNHELRTPLTAILGFSELLQRSKNLTPSEQEDVTIIYRSGNHLLDLINHVLDFSKIEANAIAIESEITHLPSLLKTVESIIQGLAIEKQLAFEREYAPNLPDYITLDQCKLRQILINLLSNAVKFTTQGRVTLQVKVQEQQLLFQVIDTGIGISPVDLPKLFDPFFQADTGQFSRQGTGLGLSISQRFVELMGGELAVQSTLGQGTIVTLTLPFEPSKTQEPPRPESLWKFPQSLSPFSILVVDHDLARCDHLMQLLFSVGFEARASISQRNAIEQYGLWQPHVLLITVPTPDRNGPTIAQQIRTFEQSRVRYQGTELVVLKETLLIALIIDPELNAAELFALGFDDFIPFPLREATLLTKLSQHLGFEYKNIANKT